MKGVGPRRTSKPLTEYQMSCGHWIGFRYLPEIGHTSWCVRCPGWATVMDQIKFVCTCENCDWDWTDTKKIRAYRVTEDHAKTEQHRAVVFDTKLIQKIFDGTPKIDGPMLDWEIRSVS